MDKKIVIAIDAMGGEQAPNKNIEGINIFYNNYKNIIDYFFNIYGDEELISEEIKKYKIPSEIYKIYHSSTVVSDEETPLTAIKNSKDRFTRAIM